MNTLITITGITTLIIFILLTLIWLNIRKNNSGELWRDLEALKGKITDFEARLQVFPDLIRSNTADIVQERFTKFSDNLSSKNQELVQRFGAFQAELTKSMGENSKRLTEDFSAFKEVLKKTITEDFDRLILSVENKLEAINTKVQENLNEGFKKSTETFNNVLERLAKIDEAQKNIENLSTNVVSLQEILSDKKSRGIFGEVQLNHILYAVFGEKNDRVFRTQYSLSNSRTVDAMLFLPAPIGNLPIDAKFPLDNYKRMIDRNLPDNDRTRAGKLFETDVKNQIDDISEKYIIPGETANQAIMFIPAEAVFAELYAYHDDLIKYAHNQRVWITSPTTFMAVLNTIQIVLRDMERQKYADIIQQEIVKLSEEFRRYRERWNKLSTHIDTVHKDIKEIHTTSSKISNAFDKIARVEIEGKTSAELPDIATDAIEITGDEN